MSGICQSGTSQSPINIRTDKVVQCQGSCDIQFFYRSSICSVENNSGNIIINYDAGSYINYNSLIYEFDKLSFSVPASHKVDHTTYPMEVFLWHKSMDLGKILILSVFVETNEATTKSKDFFNILSEGLPRYSGEERNYNTPEEWNVFSIIPENKAFYLYQGSLPQSPCTENVTWVVFDTSVNISNTIYQSIKTVIGKNSRQIQSVNGRTIYYNSNNEAKGNRNYGSKLRCYTDTELRKTCQCMCKDKTQINQFPGINTGLLLILLLAVFVIGIGFIIYKMGLFSGIKGKMRDFISKTPQVLQMEAQGTLNIPEPVATATAVAGE